MHLVRGADALGARLAQPEMADLALLDEPAHRPNRVLDRHFWIDPMLVIEIDLVDAEPLQAGLAGLLDVGRAAVDTVGAAGLAGLTELGRDDDLVAPALQGAAEQFLVVAPAIHVRAVEMIDAEVGRALQQRLGGLVVARAVGAGKRHAAEPNRQHLGSVAADPAPLSLRTIAHRFPPLWRAHHKRAANFVTSASGAV